MRARQRKPAERKKHKGGGEVKNTKDRERQRKPRGRKKPREKDRDDPYTKECTRNRLDQKHERERRKKQRDERRKEDE